MNYFKISCYVLFIGFSYLIINNYFSDEFLNKKKLARENYISFLESEIEKIGIIKSQKNFKKFKLILSVSWTKLIIKVKKDLY